MNKLKVEKRNTTDDDKIELAQKRGSRLLVNEMVLLMKRVFEYKKMIEAGDYDACKAAVKGDSAAELFVGLSYYAGIGVSVDRDKAVEWIKKSAAQGNEKAQDYLAKI